MVEILLAILKGLLPFLKESLLEGGTLRQWISKNRSTCVWLIFHAVMLMVVVHLASSLHSQNQRVYALSRENITLNKKVGELELSTKGLTDQLTQMTTDHSTVTTELSEVKEELSTYKAASTLCGVTVRPDGTYMCPRATPAPRSAPRRQPARRPAPEPAAEPPPAEPHKPTFGERLRSIFKSNKE